MLAKSVEIYQNGNDELLETFEVGRSNVVKIIIELNNVRVFFSDNDENEKIKGYMGFRYIYEEEKEVEVW